MSKSEALVGGKMSGKVAKPAGGVGEWARHSFNIQDGCSNDCRYCYAKSMAIRFRRSTPKAWKNGNLRKKNVSRKWRKNVEPSSQGNDIMFPTSHDITAANLRESVVVLTRMLAAGNKVLVVTKPWMDCVKELCEKLAPYRAQMTFRFTIGSADDQTLAFWEPGASRFKERLKSLKHAHKTGFKTSVSCEPMLDVKVDAVIEAARPFVTDSIWLGRANRLGGIIAVNCPRDDIARNEARKLLEQQNDNYLRNLHARFKDDPLIRFKDSIKKAVGIERPTAKGLDI